MSQRLKRIKALREEKGFTLIEILVAMGIISLVLVSMALLISLGFLQLNNMRIQRTASNCARMIMEYIETLPPDVLYGMSPGAPIEGDFASSSGISNLNDFINSGSDVSCKKLSDLADPVGKKVKLKYKICPGCFASDELDSYGEAWSTCYYFARVRIEYNGLNLGSHRVVDYYKKYFGETVGSCLDVPNGCGSGALPPSPGTLKNCSF